MNPLSKANLLLISDKQLVGEVLKVLILVIIFF